MLPATANTTALQAEAALDKLLEYGWLPDSNVLHASHYRFATNSIAMTYANAAGRFSVADNVCGYSFANTDAATGLLYVNTDAHRFDEEMKMTEQPLASLPLERVRPPRHVLDAIMSSYREGSAPVGAGGG